jgi:hypothetical protein
MKKAIFLLVLISIASVTAFASDTLIVVFKEDAHQKKILRPAPKQLNETIKNLQILAFNISKRVGDSNSIDYQLTYVTKPVPLQSNCLSSINDYDSKSYPHRIIYISELKTKEDFETLIFYSLNSTIFLAEENKNSKCIRQVSFGLISPIRGNSNNKF